MQIPEDCVALMTTQQVAALVTGLLEGTATAFLAGAKDRKIAYRWIKGVTPQYKSEIRLRVAAVVWRILTTSESNETIRAWFIGCNPRLADTTPLQAIRDGQFKEVLAAARAFADDGQMP